MPELTNCTSYPETFEKTHRHGTGGPQLVRHVCVPALVDPRWEFMWGWRGTHQGSLVGCQVGLCLPITEMGNNVLSASCAIGACHGKINGTYCFLGGERWRSMAEKHELNGEDPDLDFSGLLDARWRPGDRSAKCRTEYTLRNYYTMPRARSCCCVCMYVHSVCVYATTRSTEYGVLHAMYYSTPLWRCTEYIQSAGTQQYEQH